MYQCFIMYVLNIFMKSTEYDNYISKNPADKYIDEFLVKFVYISHSK